MGHEMSGSAAGLEEEILELNAVIGLETSFVGQLIKLCHWAGNLISGQLIKLGRWAGNFIAGQLIKL